MPKKWPWALDHGGFMQMKVGRVFCLGYLPTLPGDEIEFKGQVYLQMEALKHRLALRGRLDLGFFWVPHRATESAFEDHLTQGVDATTALTTTGSPATPVEWLPNWTTYPSSKPTWWMNGPLQVYNRFFKPHAGDVADVTWASAPWTGGLSEDDFKYGFPASNLPDAIWTETTNRDLDSADLEITLGATLDLTEIAEKQARARTERDRQFEDIFYEGVVDRLGGTTSIDVEPRPEKFWQETWWVGGERVTGTDNMTLGMEGGRHVGNFPVNIPKRHYPEHGCIWIMGVFRYPPFSTEECHFLMNHNSYKYISGDPQLADKYPPHALQVEDIFDTASNTNQLAHIPWFQWYRQHPNFAHPDFQNQKGFTFAQGIPTVDTGDNFYNVNIDIENFISTRFGHGIVSVDWTIDADRIIPPIEGSLYTGAEL